MSNRQDRPLAKKLLHALGLLALALFLLYVAVQFVLIFHRSYKTETAIRYTLAESLNLTGVVAGWRARDERHGGSRMLHR